MLAKIAGKSQEDLFKITKHGLGLEYAALKNAYEDKANLYNRELALGQMKNEDLVKMQEDVLKAKQEYLKKEQQYQLHNLEFDADVADKRRDAARQQSDKAKQDAKQRLEEQKRQAEEERKQREQDIKAAKELEKELSRENTIDAASSETEKKLLQLQYEYDEKKAIIQKGEGDITELVKWFNNQRHQIILDGINADTEKEKAAREEQRQREEADREFQLNKQNAYVQAHREAAAAIATDVTLSYEQRRQTIEAGELALAEMTNISQQQRTDMEKNLSDARVRIAELEYQHKTNMMNLSSNALSAFAELAGHQTGLGKGLAIAAATISMYQSAQDAYRNQLTIPEPSAQFRAVLAAAAAVAVGLKNIRSIAGVKVPGAGGSVPSPSVGGGSAPLTPQLTNTVTNLDQNSINALGNQAIRTFVTETDVTTGQETIRRINRAARIG